MMNTRKWITVVVYHYKDLLFFQHSVFIRMHKRTHTLHHDLCVNVFFLFCLHNYSRASNPFAIMGFRNQRQTNERVTRAVCRDKLTAVH